MDVKQRGLRPLSLLVRCTLSFAPTVASAISGAVGSTPPAQGFAQPGEPADATELSEVTMYQPRVFQIGKHSCLITPDATRIACRDCKRYITSYKGRWSNLGTFKRQPCKPKTSTKLSFRAKRPANKNVEHYLRRHQVLTYASEGQSRKTQLNPRTEETPPVLHTQLH
eukprot:4450247-Amphidinium_carterae.1